MDLEAKAEYIVCALRKLRRKGLLGTRRWLVKELRQQGYPEISESILSRILLCEYTTGCARDVLDLSMQIVNKHLEKVS